MILLVRLFVLWFVLTSAAAQTVSALLEWDASLSSDVAGYHVYRRTGADGLFTRLNATLLPSTARSYTDSTVQYGQVYAYRATAVSSTGLESVFSDTVTLDLTDQGPTNRPPEAVDDAAATTAGQPVTIPVLANDSDPDGDPLTVTGVTQPANGSVQVNPNQSVTYTPFAGFTGTDTFTYTISDGRGGTATASVTVTVTQSSTNLPPVANNVAATTQQGQAVTIDVTANDSDPDGDPLTVTAVTQPAHGSTSILSASTVRYTPEPGFHGTDTFGYQIGDGRGGTATAQVAVTVSPTAPESTSLIFPQFVNGGDARGSAKPNSSRIILRNNSSQEAVVGIHFRTGSGAPQAIPIVGVPGPRSDLQRSIPPFGLTEVETDGSGTLRVGVVEVGTLIGEPDKLEGTLVFSLFGTFVSIDSSPVRRNHPVVISFDPHPILGENTGIAAYNPDPENTATVRISLRDETGSASPGATRLVPLGPRQQLLGFVTEQQFFRDFFVSRNHPFLGTMEVAVTEGPEIAILGLTQKTAAFDSALVAYPALDSEETALIFPQFVDGGDTAGSPLPNSSRILVRNGNPFTEAVELAFFDSFGDPIPVPVNGVQVSTLERVIPPLGVARIETDGTGNTKFGVVRLEAEGEMPVSGTLVYSLFGNFVSVGSSPLRSHHQVFVGVNPHPVLGENTGVAIYNPHPTAVATMRLRLRDQDGVVRETFDNLRVEPGEQFLGFVTEEGFFRGFFQSQGQAFLGTIEVTVTSGPQVAVLGLIQKKAPFDSALVAVSTSSHPLP